MRVSMQAVGQKMTWLCQVLQKNSFRKLLVDGV